MPAISPDIISDPFTGNERTKGFEINAFNYCSQAAAERAKASGAPTEGIFGGLSSALGAAARFKK